MKKYPQTPTKTNKIMLIITNKIDGLALAKKRQNFINKICACIRLLNRASGMMLYSRAYSTQRYHSNLYGYWQRLQSYIEYVRWKLLYPGSIHASIRFLDPYHRTIDFEVITLALIQLVEQYAYNIDSDYLRHKFKESIYLVFYFY